MWLDSIHHIQITFPPEVEDAMRFFYSTALELVELTKPELLNKNRGVWYLLGDIQLHVSLEQDAQNYASRRHICFQVRDLNAFREHLQMKGVEIIPDSQPITECDRFYLRDPGGNRIEIISTQV